MHARLIERLAALGARAIAFDVLFADPRDPAAIAEAIEYLLTHPDEAEAMGERGRAAVRDRFNWDRDAGRLLSLYRDLQAAG